MKLRQADIDAMINAGSVVDDAETDPDTLAYSDSECDEVQAELKDVGSGDYTWLYALDGLVKKKTQSDAEASLRISSKVW